MNKETTLKIAIQKSGRLSDDSIALLKECGIDMRNVKDRLRTVSENFPIEVFFLRDDDIPEYVEDGVADLGIVGQNVLAEKNRKVITVEALGFGKCRLSIALPKAFNEAEVILDSQAVLISNQQLNDEQKNILDKLLFRIRAVKKAKKNKYVLMNAPNEKLSAIISLLPGMKSPSVLPLAETGWSSIHSVLSEDEFWEKIEQLKNAGAEGILVVPIEKMIF